VALHPANVFVNPGGFVRHPKAPELGLGRVQTVVGDKITINFENAGKLIVNGATIELMVVDPSDKT